MKFFNWFGSKKTQEKALSIQQFYGTGTIPNLKNLNPDNQAILKYFAGTVYAAAQRHSDKIAATTLRLYSQKARTNVLKAYEAKALIARTNAKHITTSLNIGEITQHDSLTLLNRPNPYMTGRGYRKYAELYNVITGVSYTEIKWAENTPVQLWLLPPHKVSVNKAENGFPTSFNYGDDNILAENMLVETAENLSNPYAATAGKSPVRAILEKLQLAEYVTTKLVALMSAPKFTGILTPRGEDSQLPEEQRTRWESKLQQYRHQKEGDLLFLDGDVRFEPVNQNATDLAAVEILKQIDEMIARVFQMPLMILRGSEGASRASYEAAVQEWVDGGISSRLREIEDWLNFQFLPQFPNSEDLFFAYDDPSPLNELQDVQLYTLACGGAFLSVNEARQETGWEKRKDGDSIRILIPSETTALPEEPIIEGGDTATPLATAQQITTNPALTLNGAQITSAVSIVQQVAAGTLPREAGIGMLQTLVNLTPSQAELCMGSVGNGFVPVVPEAPTSPVNDVPPEKSIKALTPPTGKALAPLTKVLRKHFAKWRLSAESSIGKSLENIEIKSVNGVIKGLPSRFIPSDKWAKDLAEDSQPMIEIFLKERGHKLLQRVGASKDKFAVFDKNVAKQARAATIEFAKSTLDTTTKSINEAMAATREAIAEGLDSGESIADLKKKVGGIFENLEGSRAELIAQTEASRAYHEGLRESAKISGVVKGLKHLTSSEPCQICEELDGKVYDLDEPLPPENSHPLCECTLLEVLDESMLEGDE